MVHEFQLKRFILLLCLCFVGCDIDSNSSDKASNEGGEEVDVNSQAWVFGIRYLGGREINYPADSDKDIWVEQATVTTFIPVNPTRPPIVMVPGFGLSGSLYMTAGQGKQKGWAQIFAEAGYPVYVYEIPEYSTSGGFELGLLDAQTDPATFKVHKQIDYRKWIGFNPDDTDATDSKFPLDQAAIDEFEKSFPYRFSDNNDSQDIAPNTQETETEVLIDLYDVIGEPFILMTHSAGTKSAPIMLEKQPTAIKALIAYESAGLYSGSPEAGRQTPPEEAAILHKPFAEAFAQTYLTGKPYLSLYGDRVAERGHGGRQLLFQDLLVPAVAATGTAAKAINLPELGIMGNSHLMAQDSNNAEIANLVIEWLNEHVEPNYTASP
jgi:pimeloyl-ACP methyl ester carboxylesterase